MAPISLNNMVLPSAADSVAGTITKFIVYKITPEGLGIAIYAALSDGTDTSFHKYTFTPGIADVPSAKLGNLFVYLLSGSQ